MHLYLSSGRKVKLPNFNNNLKKRKLFVNELIDKYPNEFNVNYLSNHNYKTKARLDMLGFYLCNCGKRTNNNKYINSYNKLKRRKKTELPAGNLIEECYS